jgi:hypothetical protein
MDWKKTEGYDAFALMPEEEEDNDDALMCLSHWKQQSDWEIDGEQMSPNAAAGAKMASQMKCSWE